MTFSWAAIWQGLPYLLQGAALTIFISLTAMLLGLILGVLIALLSEVPSRGIRVLIRAYIEIFRNTPLLIQIFIVYFGLPQLGLKLSPFFSGLSALTLYTAAYNVEIFRAGLDAVPKGQEEAARSTGLTPLQAAVYVIIPQALRIAFPALGNNLVTLLKNSSLVSTIGMVELMFVANDISFNNFRSFEIYGATAVLYVLLVLALTWTLTTIERRLLLKSSR